LNTIGTPFHKIQHSVLAFQTPSTLWTYHNVPQLENTLFYPNYILGENLKNQQFDSIRPLYLTYEKNIIVIDGKNPIYSSTVVKSNWVILINSPKINLDRVLNELKPELVIADGSNFKTYRERWTKSCSKQKISHCMIRLKKGLLYIRFMV
jgi:competence protein ComEC